MVQQYKDANMALEGVIIDNYNQNQNALFTVSTANFTGLLDFSDQLASLNQHIILGLESGISVTNGDPYLTSLIKSLSMV